MRKRNEEVDKKIEKVLNEKETFLLSLMLLVNMSDDEKYKDIADLIFLFDDYKKYKRFIKYYEGKTIQVPTVKEVKRALRLLEMFQKLYIDQEDFETAYDDLKLWEIGVTKGYAKEELARFKDFVEKNGSNITKKLKKLKKLK